MEQAEVDAPDGDLDDPLSSVEQCLSVNDKLQNCFTGLLLRIEEALLDNAQHQEELEAAMAKARNSLYNQAKPRKITLTRFHCPFVRDQSGNVPAPNADVRKLRESGDVNPMHVSSSAPWSKAEIDALKRGTNILTREKVMKPAQRLKNKYNKEMIHRKTASHRRNELSAAIDKIDQDLKEMKSNPPAVDPDDMDWDKISSNFVSNRSAKECEMFWRRHNAAGCSMADASREWTTVEDDRLLSLLPEAKRGRPNWQQIAKELDAGRTPFECLARFEKLCLSNVESNIFVWTPDETHKLVNAVEVFGACRWRAISDHIGSKAPSRCCNRYRTLGAETGLRRCSWTVSEDKALLKALALYGPGRWSLISRMVPGRTVLQCRTRYTTCFAKPFTKEEDELLIKSVGLFVNPRMVSWGALVRKLKWSRKSSALLARWRILRDENREKEANEVAKESENRSAPGAMSGLPTLKPNMRIGELLNRRKFGYRSSDRLLAKVQAETQAAVHEKSLQLLQQTKARQRTRQLNATLQRDKVSAARKKATPASAVKTEEQAEEATVVRKRISRTLLPAGNSFVQPVKRAAHATASRTPAAKRPRRRPVWRDPFVMPSDDEESEVALSSDSEDSVLELSDTSDSELELTTDDGDDDDDDDDEQDEEQDGCIVNTGQAASADDSDDDSDDVATSIREATAAHNNTTTSDDDATRATPVAAATSAGRVAAGSATITVDHDDVANDDGESKMDASKAIAAAVPADVIASADGVAVSASVAAVGNTAAAGAAGALGETSANNISASDSGSATAAKDTAVGTVAATSTSVRKTIYSRISAAQSDSEENSGSETDWVVAGEVIKPRFFTTSRQLAIAQRNLTTSSSDAATGILSTEFTQELKRRSVVATKAAAATRAAAKSRSTSASGTEVLPRPTASQAPRRYQAAANKGKRLPAGAHGG
eukprot:scpid66959/ scgid22878/ snRNA-activating protein complex subunit 4; snRNA-activating protein complex 190 kDa subunit